MRNDQFTAVTKEEDRPAFHVLEANLRLMDAELYKNATVDSVATHIVYQGETLEPPDGCIFVFARVGAGGKPVLLTLQDMMLNPPNPEQSRFRITPEQVEDEIARITYSMPPSGKTILCEITLQNGFIVTGESHVVDPQNFDFARGCQYAFTDARGKVFEVLAFRAQDDLDSSQRVLGIRKA